MLHVTQFNTFQHICVVDMFKGVKVFQKGQDSLPFRQ